ncbi:hypothetical protein [Dickeya chrysanthemi]|uniref:Uncharacterized protein n=1 Tax=Dickeya chrysanthemi TaxID=556 RepID=A0ABU8JKP9_DICCH|nr:hypothetical protein [Dickeya chrysanthemi]
MVKAPEEAKIFFTVAQDAAAPYIVAGKWNSRLSSKQNASLHD